MTAVSDWVSEFAGPKGTPRRDRFDRGVARIHKRERIANAVTRHWPGVMRIFWIEFFEDLSLHGAADALSFSYLGDFMFWGKPMTESYAQSRLSRIRLPRWLHR